MKTKPSPHTSQTENLRKVSWQRRLLGMLATRVFADGLETLNRRARRSMEVNTSARILDVGTGDGKVLRYLAEAAGSARLEALDLVPMKSPGVRIHRADLEKPFPLPNGRFDVVISSQNIEHIIDVPLYCSEIARVLKPGGYALVLTENLASWTNIAPLFFGWIPFSLTNMFGIPYGNPLIWHAEIKTEAPWFREAQAKRQWGVLGHQRVLTIRAIEQLFRERGLVPEKRLSGGYFTTFGLAERFLSRLDPIHSHFIGMKFRKKS